MPIRTASAGLLLGIISAVASFLFWATDHDTYLLLITGGLLLSFVCFLVVLFQRGTVKSKLFWTAVVIIAIPVQRLSEPVLIRASYLIFLARHGQELAAVNALLQDKRGSVSVMGHGVYDKDSLLNSGEKDQLRVLRKQLGVYLIGRSDKGVHYGLWGFLDIRLGLTWWTSKQVPDAGNRHLTGNWYY